MNFVLNRNRTLASATGHSIEFKKGVPVHVPPEVYDEAVSIGAVPEDELPESDAPTSNEPADATERQTAIFAAFESIMARGRRDDFSATGAPSGKALNTELGWPVPTRERASTWEAFKAVKGDPEGNA